NPPATSGRERELQEPHQPRDRRRGTASPEKKGESPRKGRRREKPFPGERQRGRTEEETTGCCRYQKTLAGKGKRATHRYGSMNCPDAPVYPLSRWGEVRHGRRKFLFFLRSVPFVLELMGEDKKPPAPGQSKLAY